MVPHRMSDSFYLTLLRTFSPIRALEVKALIASKPLAAIKDSDMKAFLSAPTDEVPAPLDEVIPIMDGGSTTISARLCETRRRDVLRWRYWLESDQGIRHRPSSSGRLLGTTSKATLTIQMSLLSVSYTSTVAAPRMESDDVGPVAQTKDM
jgi:hypothetical protein